MPQKPPETARSKESAGRSSAAKRPTYFAAQPSPKEGRVTKPKEPKPKKRRGRPVTVGKAKTVILRVHEPLSAALTSLIADPTNDKAYPNLILQIVTDWLRDKGHLPL
jgi:hypothetical protein